jgi:hypothetical protein
LVCAVAICSAVAPSGKAMRISPTWTWPCFMLSLASAMSTSVSLIETRLCTIDCRRRCAVSSSRSCWRNSS